MAIKKRIEKEMSKAMKYLIIFILATIASFTAYFQGRNDMKKKIQKEIIVQTDTLIVKDTIRLTEYKRVTTKVVDTLFVPITDTLHIHDTTYITLYKEVKTYEDSLFKAQISGIQPNLDWIEVYPQTHYITTTISKKPKHFGLGVQAGLGLSSHGFTPYIGVGVSWNFWNF